MSLLCYLGTLFLGVQTQPVKRNLCQLAEGLAPSGYIIKVKGLQGILPFDIVLDEFLYANAQGPIIHVQDFRFKWSILGLVDKRIDIPFVGAQKLYLGQIPSQQKDPKQKTSLQVPQLPLMAIHQLAFDNITLDKQLVGQDAVLSLHGQGQILDKHKIQGELHLARTDQDGLRAHIQAGYLQKTGHLKLKTMVSSPSDGLFLQDLPLPWQDKLEVRLQGQGLLTDWQGHLQLVCGPQQIFDALVHFKRHGGHYQLATKGSFDHRPFIPDRFKPKIRPLANGLDFDLGLFLCPEKQSLVLKDCLLRLAQVELRFHGSWQMDDSFLNMSSSLKIPHLGKLQSVIGQDLSGSLSLNSQVKGPIKAPDVTGKISLKDVLLSSWSVRQNTLSFSCLPQSGKNQDFLEGLFVSVSGKGQGIFLNNKQRIPDPVEYDLALKLHSLQDIEIKRAHMSTGDIKASLVSRVKTTGALKAHLTLASSRIEDLPFVKSSHVQGKVHIESRLSGNWKRQLFTVQTKGTMAEVAGLPQEMSAILGQNLALELDNTIQGPGVIDINSLKLSGQHVRMKCQGRLNLSGQPSCHVDWQVSGPNFDLLQTGFYRDMTGVFQARGGVEGLFQDLDSWSELTIKDLSVPGLLPSTAVVTSDIHHLPDRPQGTISLQISRNGKKIALKTDLELAEHMLKINSFRLEAPQTSFQGKGSFMWASALIKGTLEGQAKSLTWLKTFGSLALPGSLSLQVATDGQTFQANLEILDVACHQLPLKQAQNIKGTADVKFEAKGPLESPEMSFSIRAQEIHPLFQAGLSLPHTSVFCKGVFQDRELALELRAKNAHNLKVLGNVTVPLWFRLRPFELRLPRTIQGELAADFDLRYLNHYLSLEGQDLTGQSHAHLSFTGPLSHPSLQGELRLTGGGYENILSGTILQDMHMMADFHKDILRIKELRATDGDHGQISGSGQVNVASLHDIGYELALFMDKARLTRLDMIQAAVSGHLTLEGTLNTSKIQGNLTIFPVEIQIPRPGPQQMKDFQVISLEDLQAGRERFQPETESSFLADTRLDIKITFPNALYVRGQGIESEWKGTISISGSGNSPQLNGRLNLLRGSVDFLTKTFALQKGEIRFTGSFPPDPIIDMTAVQARQDFTLMIHLMGSVSHLKISLGSEPPYPQEEILSRFLFHRKLSEITPVQAVKLALALKSLATGQGGVGVLDRIRHVINVDELNIEQSSQTGGTVVGVGKYVNKNIFFKAEKSLGTQEGKIVVDIELTPRIGLETEVGATNMGGEVQWTYRY